MKRLFLGVASVESIEQPWPYIYLAYARLL